MGLTIMLVVVSKLCRSSVLMLVLMSLLTILVRPVVFKCDELSSLVMRLVLGLLRSSVSMVDVLRIATY